MNILILGGTGAMGRPLIQILSVDNSVFVTTRKSPTSIGILDDNPHIKYVNGNAKSRDFLVHILSERRWDAIVDFMIWSSEFAEVLPLMLANTNQYVFISSARVYSKSNAPITEETPRLLDVSEDKQYLKTNEYALSKAREENLLFESGKKNFTIVRPTITYYNSRLQLGVLEKENWLYRALHGRKIVFSKDIGNKITTMTYGYDVAVGIASLIGKKDSLGEAFHITCTQSLTWNEVLSVYLDALEEYRGRRPEIFWTEKSTNLTFKTKIYQVIYCRYFNRTFDNSKISKFCNVDGFTLPQKGLKECLHHFLKSPSFLDIDWRLEGVNDLVSGERTPLSEIPSVKERIQYVAYRYNLHFIDTVYNAIAKVNSYFLRRIYKILKFKQNKFGN